MNRISRIAPVLALMSVAALSACPKKAPPPPPPPVVNEDSIRAEEARRDSIARAEQERLEAERRRQDSVRAEQERRDRMMAEARSTITAQIYFDYDRSDITEQSRTTLDAKLPLLNANPNLRIRIAGHTDERGSDEYNMALGQRRAAAAKRYLVQHGITEDRIETVSFGEEQPATQGSDESAWSQNRRDEFEIIAGGDELTLPQQ